MASNLRLRHQVVKAIRRASNALHAAMLRPRVDTHHGIHRVFEAVRIEPVSPACVVSFRLSRARALESKLCGLLLGSDRLRGDVRRQDEDEQQAGKLALQHSVRAEADRKSAGRLDRIVPDTVNMQYSIAPRVRDCSE